MQDGSNLLVVVSQKDGGNDLEYYQPALNNSWPNLERGFFVVFAAHTLLSVSSRRIVGMVGVPKKNRGKTPRLTYCRY